MLASVRRNASSVTAHHKTLAYLDNVMARREALAADVVVVNHHLLFADLAIKRVIAAIESGGGGRFRPSWHRVA